jgi:hypothetical protein
VRGAAGRGHPDGAAVTRERWPGERYDAEGRRWHLRNGPWFVWSDIRTRHPGRGGIVAWRATSLSVWLIIVLLLFAVSSVGTMWSLIRSSNTWPTLLNVIVWGSLGALYAWRTYMPSRRYVLSQQRVRERLCPCCAQPLLHDDRAGGDTHRRCSECGHLWKWPPAQVEEPYIGW